MLHFQVKQLVFFSNDFFPLTFPLTISLPESSKTIQIACEDRCLEPLKAFLRGVDPNTYSKGIWKPRVGGNFSEPRHRENKDDVMKVVSKTMKAWTKKCMVVS